MFTSTSASHDDDHDSRAMTGELFIYAGGRVAFETPPDAAIATAAATATAGGTTTILPARNKKCILLGGLSDGLLPVPYVTRLQKEVCAPHGWSLVQPIMSSSYTGFGHGTLDRDATELQELLAYLMEHKGGEHFVIMGHSTGCQNVVHYLRTHGSTTKEAHAVVAAMLQAPVSDRQMQHEHDATHPDTVQRQAYLQMAEKLVQENNNNDNGNGDGGEEEIMMPRSAFWTPITAQRYLDLHAINGRDDYFSSDLTDAQLTARLSHMTKRPIITTTTTTTATASAAATTTGHYRRRRSVVVAYSGADEYVPSWVNSKDLMHRLVQAMNARHNEEDTETNKTTATTTKEEEDGTGAVGLYLATGNHALYKTRSDIDALLQQVSAVLQEWNAILLLDEGGAESMIE